MTTNANRSSVVPVTGDTHVVHGCDTVTVTRQKEQQMKKKESVSTDEMRRYITQWGLHTPTDTRSKVWKYVFKYTKCQLVFLNESFSVFREIQFKRFLTPWTWTGMSRWLTRLMIRDPSQGVKIHKDRSKGLT